MLVGQLRIVIFVLATAVLVATSLDEQQRAPITQTAATTLRLGAGTESQKDDHRGGTARGRLQRSRGVNATDFQQPQRSSIGAGISRPPARSQTAAATARYTRKRRAPPPLRGMGRSNNDTSSGRSGSDGCNYSRNVVVGGRPVNQPTRGQRRPIPQGDRRNSSRTVDGTSAREGLRQHGQQHRPQSHDQQHQQQRGRNRNSGTGRGNDTSGSFLDDDDDDENMPDFTPQLSAADFAAAAQSLAQTSWLTRLREGIQLEAVEDANNNASQEQARSRQRQEPLSAYRYPGSTCRQFNWTETAAVQALLQRHQNPTDCASAKFIVCHPRRSGGLAAQLVQLKNTLTAGLMSGRVVVLDDANGWELVDETDCDTRTFDCLFEPLTHCKLPQNHAGGYGFGHGAGIVGAESLNHPHVVQMRVVHVDISVNAYSKHVPDPFRDKDQFWWLAQALMYVFRPLPQTLEPVRAFAATQHWGSPRVQTTAALHLRSADRGKNYLGPLLEWVRRDAVLSTVDRVFVATDDREAVKLLDEVSQRERAAGGLFGDVIYDQQENRRQHVVQDILHQQEHNAGRRINATQLTFEAIKNLVLLASGQYFVGTLDSGFSTVAAALGCVEGDVLAEPLVFGHWKKNQDPAAPPVSVMGTTYYVGPGLPLGVRAAGNFNPFNTSDHTSHTLRPA